MALANANQFKHVRAMHICLGCGGPKSVGLLVCWKCNNTLKARFDGTYGREMDHAIEIADEFLSHDCDVPTGT